MKPPRHRAILWLLRNAPLMVFLLILAIFGSLSPKYLTPPNLINILIQSSPTAIVAIGMTFVLLTGGVDLSVGAIWFVGGAVAGKMALAGHSLGMAAVVMVLLGLVLGAVNAFFVVRLRIIPFVVTLATLYLWRGLGLWITQTRAMNLPESFLHFGAAQVVGVPVPILILGFVIALSHGLLEITPYGRQIYAVGQDAEAASKAGVNTARILASVYLICGTCAAIGGVVSLTQLGAVSPTFGNQKEFSAIAAAVLGGTSLFGGSGKVFPGTVMGAVLMQAVENGLVLLNANPYLYPVITSAIIFLAVLIDSQRHAFLQQIGRRHIRIAADGPLAP